MVDVLNDLDDVIGHLVNAKYFNRLWHSQIEFVNSSQLSHLSLIEQEFIHVYIHALLAQKTNCQMTALCIVYDKAIQSNWNYESCGLVLELDANEKGVDGNGVYYGLYPKGRFDLACHIPKEKLLDGLTYKQQQFFNLIF